MFLQTRLEMDMQATFGTTRDAAQAAGVSASFLKKIRIYTPEKGPPFLRLGRKILYPMTGPHSVESWLLERLQNARTNS